VILLFLSYIFLLKTQSGFAQKKDFAHVVPFVLDEGELCLFDQTEGKLYLYDKRWEKCALTIEISELGEPLKTTRLKKFSGSY